MATPCCNDPKIMEYSIEHNPKPIELPQDLLEAIERLLWYVPEINSFQSPSNELIKEKIYNDFLFNYILEKIKMQKEDVIFEDEKADLTKYYNDFNERICVNCQKLILTKKQRERNPETQTMCMLRHIRNSIAHGRFNLCGDMMIGFDCYEKNDNTVVYTAFIKIRPKTLLEALKLLDSGITYQHLFAYAFRKIGYSVTEEPRVNANVTADMFLQKDGKSFLIEIKKYSRGYLREDMVYKLIQMYSNTIQQLGESTKLVLIIDTARLTKSSEKLLKDEKIKVMDINKIKELLKGNDVLSKL